MNHPNREEWLPYLAGDSPPAARRRLDEHLDSCTECATEIAAWRRVEKRLEGWELPRLETCPEDRFLTFRPVMKWAAAAALVLSVGFGLGRLTSRETGGSSEGRNLSELRQELAADFQTAFAQAQSQSSNALAALELRLTKASQTDSRRLLQAVNEVLGRAREEDRRAVLALFHELEEQNTTAYVTLRRDLETVASFSDDGMREARLKFVQLVRQAPTDAGEQPDHQ